MVVWQMLRPALMLSQEIPKGERSWKRRLTALVVVIPALSLMTVLALRQVLKSTKTMSLRPVRINLLLISLCFQYSPCYVESFVHSFVSDISIAPLQFHYYSEALSTTAVILCWS